MPRTMSSSGFPPPPPFTRNILLGLLVLYIFELLLQSWIGFPIDVLGWHPNSNFALYQPLTCYLVQGQRPLSVLFSLLMVYFFFPTVQQSFGKSGLLRLIYLTVSVGVFWGAIMVVSGAVSQPHPFMGIAPFITAALVVFGLTNPRATILLFFIIPIQAAWIAWGTGLLAFLNFLFGRSLESAMICSGWISGFLYMQTKGHFNIRSLYTQYKHKQTQKRIRNFRVIDGGNKTKSKQKRPRDDWH